MSGLMCELLAHFQIVRSLFLDVYLSLKVYCGSENPEAI